MTVVEYPSGIGADLQSAWVDAALQHARIVHIITLVRTVSLGDAQNR
jgi:hypothetical protein